MKSGPVAKRYASALIQVARGENKVSEYLSELERLVQLLRGNRELQTFLNSPVVKPSSKKDFFKTLQEKMKLSPSVLRLIYVLLDHDRGDALPLVYLVYRDMADELLGQVRATVVSAAPLGEQEAKLKGLLQTKFKRTVLLEVKVDPQILGGLVVQVNDVVFDGSLKRELERVKAAIVQKAVA